MPAGRQPVEQLRPVRISLPEDHRHLLDLEERRSSASARRCWALRSGEAAATARPARGSLWLDDFELPDELWAALQIPIGLAFFLRSSVDRRRRRRSTRAPPGATESELDLEAWDELVGRNPVLAGLEPDAEALVVNRIADRPSTRSSPSTRPTGWWA